MTCNEYNMGVDDGVVMMLVLVMGILQGRLR